MNLFVDNKPSIHIRYNSSEFPSEWQEVLFGIEEESIPFQLEEIANQELISQAYEASQLSALSVGIACTEQEMVIHQKNLPEEAPLFTANTRTIHNSAALRALGNNAARLVKGIPFKNTFDQTGE
ncbi:glycerol dehydratase reactivase beta/small subunit family protein [Vibrio hannami]|uniref:glycerol dehydratase reactivase beta/small subunit family protein n=1 Tax=Vibrio hannami TaxID=2717094 RepID=UPI0024109CB4|nr:glycerol dehydratase reactivase beta/small subunit family protein [Vibrio hannami]MDG3085142.1 glycerol dehydratase reactivase beta/small subunit family protein [Vibrio hannami]